MNDPSIFRFFNEIGIINQLASTKLGSVLPDSLKMSQFSVLNHLVRLGGEWSPLRLAKAFQVTKGAMTNTLNRLEKRALIEIRPDPEDGRGKLVRITAKGEKMRQECLMAIDPFIQKIEEELGLTDFTNSLPALEKVRKYLDEERFKDT